MLCLPVLSRVGKVNQDEEEIVYTHTHKIYIYILILRIYIIYIYIDHLLHVTKNVRKKNWEKNPKKKKMEVTTREHLLFCTTCLFSFYYRRRSFCLLACTKRGEGCLSAACDDCQSVIHSWTEFVLFVKHRFYYLCCSSSHHSPLLLMCFFLFFAGRLF